VFVRLQRKTAIPQEQKLMKLLRNFISPQRDEKPPKGGFSFCALLRGREFYCSARRARACA
jgi:hypothetical protein